MPARFVSSKVYKTVIQGTKTLSVGFVDRTTAWTRPSEMPVEKIKEEFSDMVQANIARFRKETVEVAMKEPEHPSDRDEKPHYTVYELDANKEVLGVIHLPRKVQK